ncbi:MAG: winged helix-turn-helix domain-containing protein [Thermoplasmata archaeon]|nr:winged helix-turn-helix domain-containing protein [Thermoplasmata archaeon]
MTDGPLTDFELYYTKNGLVQVSNDVRRQILHELETKNLSLTDLSKITGKAQSTLSVHLDKMISEGLITVHDDPEDSRRKVYSLISVMLAYSKPPSDEAMTIAMKVLSEVADDPIRTRDALAKFIFLGFDGMGLSVGPMATILGSIHAMALGGILSGKNIEDTVANARDYYKKMGFGDASIYSLNPLSVIIKDDLSFTEDSAKSLGYYATGFFSKILEDATGKAYVVVSSEVFGTDCNYFRFTLEPVAPKQ